MDANRRITLIEPKRGMPLADFHAHWSGPHAEIAVNLPGLTWYVQNHVVRPLSDATGRWADIHGIAEIAFKDPRGIFDTIDKWSRVDELREDEDRFIDRRIGSWAVLRDQPPQLSTNRIIVILDPPADGQSPMAETVARVLQVIGDNYPCHAVATASGPSSGQHTLPAAFIFIELPDGGSRDADVSVMRHLNGLDCAAYLVRAEVKRRTDRGNTPGN